MLKIINFTLCKNCSMAIIQKYVRTFKLHGKLKGNIPTILPCFSSTDFINIQLAGVQKRPVNNEAKFKGVIKATFTQNHVNRTKI